MNEKKGIYFRTVVVYVGFAALLVYVLIKTLTIQMEGRTTMLSDSKEKIPTRIIKRIPRRGEILDANYTPLVTSVSFYEIHMDPTVIDQKIFDDQITDLANGLSKVLPSMSSREWENWIRRGRQRGNRYLNIKSKATNEERRQFTNDILTKL